MACYTINKVNTNFNVKFNTNFENNENENNKFNFENNENENDKFNFENNENENNKFNFGNNDKLNLLRNKIDNIDKNTWKKIRILINNYDFKINKKEIVNRAFYKYWEIINKFDIYEKYSNDDIILHCAEAPGGFIQCSLKYLDTIEQKDTDSDNWTEVKNHNCKKKIYTKSLNT